MRFWSEVFEALAFVVLFALVLLGLRQVALGQTPTPRPNPPLVAIGGVYRAACVPTPPMDDVVQACFVRTDVTPIVELGCAAVTPEIIATLDPTNFSTLPSLDLTVPLTEGDDAEIRCYTLDSSGLASDISDNAGIVDFTRPGRPYVLSIP